MVPRPPGLLACSRVDPVCAAFGIRGWILDRALAGAGGGEEFLIVATETAGGNAGVLAEKLRAALEAHRFEDGLQVTLSGGVAQYLPGETLQHLLKRVDAALYEAKRGGRNQVLAA